MTMYKLCLNQDIIQVNVLINIQNSNLKRNDTITRVTELEYTRLVIVSKTHNKLIIDSNTPM